MKAVWNNNVVAESDDTVVVEGNHYFPRASVDESLLEPSNHTTTCPWKGKAQYYSIVAGGKRNENAAWYYPEPSEAAQAIRGKLAFWKGVVVEP